MLSAFSTALVETRAYDGCVSVETYVDADSPDTVVLIEERESRKQNELYMAWRIESGMVEMMTPILAAPLEIRYLKPNPT